MFYLVDKPVGPSSNQVLSHVRRFFKAGKAGHSGTLDPLASGLLIVATDGSTKLLSLLESHTKGYVFTFDLTRTSESLDLGTPTTPLLSDHPIFQNPPSEIQARDILASFRGTIQQVPPKYSAIWLDGQRAYDRARKGHEVDIPSREITVHSLELVSYQFPFVTLAASVSSGGYVRSLARDIGTALGGLGVVTELRRTQIDTWPLVTADLDYHELHPGEMIGLTEISYGNLFPEIGRVDMDPDEYHRVFHGHVIPKRDTYSGPLVFGYHEGRPMALFRNDPGLLSPIRFKI